MTATPSERSAFAERMRLQLASRYRDIEVSVEPGRFAIRLVAPGLDVVLPLAPLHHDCLRDPTGAGGLITSWMSSADRRLTSAPAPGFTPSALLWCVRSRRYIADHMGAGELLVDPVGTDMAAFICETLPGSVMRGVPRAEWERRGMDDADVRAIAGSNTETRFAKIGPRIGAAERIPRDGWRLSGDALFQGSVVTVPGILRALVDRAGGDVLLGIPDRSLVFAMPDSTAMRRAFGHRVNRAFREAMHPCSARILTTDGETLQGVSDGPRGRRWGTGLLRRPRR